MDYGTVNAEESAEEYQDELTVEESRDQWAKRHWSLLALKELQVEMKFQDQAIGQRGQRHHGGTGLGEIGGMLGSYRRSGLQKLLEPLEQSKFQTAASQRRNWLKNEKRKNGQLKNNPGGGK